jgi:hypothetical protein
MNDSEVDYRIFLISRGVTLWSRIIMSEETYSAINGQELAAGRSDGSNLATELIAGR